MGFAMAVTIKDKVIGNHIKAARKRSGLTQAKVADELDVSISYYSRIECGEVRINLERLLEICALLKTHPHSILKHCCEQLEDLEESSEENPLTKNIIRLMNSASSETQRTMNAACEAIYKQAEQR